MLDLNPLKVERPKTETKNNNMMKKALCLLSCAILLSGALHSVAASPNQVTLVDDGATKVVNAASLNDVIVKLTPTPLLECIVITEPVSEFISLSSVAVKAVKLFDITPESAADRVRENQLASNYKTGYRPPAFRPEKTGKIYLRNCSIRYC